jgi:hypothetical protein
MMEMRDFRVSNDRRRETKDERTHFENAEPEGVILWQSMANSMMPG